MRLLLALPAAAIVLLAGGAPPALCLSFLAGVLATSALSDLLSELCKEPPMAGYANRIIHIPFPQLSEESDPVWVAILNPRQQPPDKLRPREIPTDEAGKPVNEDDAVEAMYEMIAGLVIGWHVYDATASAIEIDPATGQAVNQDQPLLPQVTHSNPATAEQVRKLPMDIITRISEELKISANPQ